MRWAFVIAFLGVAGIGGLRPSVGGYGEIDQAPAFEA
jgi:hypothetical protein